jgi:hypothetical protein
MAMTNSERPQYHHFIPRLILRGFAQEKQDHKPDLRRSSKKQRNKQKKDAEKDGVIHFIKTPDGTCGEGLVSRHFGLTDMYRETMKSDPFDLEKKLSELEAQAGAVLAKARKTFVQPGAILTLTRIESYRLRKFLFMMKYRSSSFHTRYDVATIEEYMEPDKEKLRRYMRLRKFTSPREVWLANLHMFLKADMDFEREWQRDLRHRAYKEDVDQFLFHVEHSFVAFCSPQNIDDEFLLTENAYGVYEGADSGTMSTAAHVMNQKVVAEWHNFAPITATLLIVLRSNRLHGNVLSGGLDIQAAMEDLVMKQVFPEPAVSALLDLPIERCETSYNPIYVNGVNMSAQRGHPPSKTDRYFFRCFRLDRQHMAKINTVFLDGALPKSTIVYKRAAAAARSIRAYLEDPRPILKILGDHGSPRDRYLRALERALESLEVVRAPVNTISRRIIWTQRAFPLDYARHHTRWTAICVGEELCKDDALMRLWRKLEGDTAQEQHRSRTRWIEDIEQAGLIACFHVKIDSEMNKLGFDPATILRCRRVRNDYFGTMKPRICWLYHKVMRNLCKFSTENFRIKIADLECQGWEDGVGRWL